MTSVEGAKLRSSKRHRNEEQSISIRWWTSVNFGVRTHIPEVQRQSRGYWKGLVCVPNGGCKSNECHSKASRMCRTSRRCNTSLYPSQNGRCFSIVETSEVRMSRYLDTSTKTQMAEIMVQHGRPICSSGAKSVWSHTCWITVGKTFWKSVIGLGWETQQRQRSSEKTQRHVWIQDLRTLFRVTWRRLLCMVLWYGRSCKKKVWSDNASWLTKQLSSFTKSQLHALVTINVTKKNWDLLKNCHKYALKIFSNACICHVLVDLTFFGL